MSENPKKLAVLSALQKQGDFVTLPELLLTLGEGFAQRSVRRWLAEMITEGLVKKSGEKRSTKYLAIKHNVSESIHFQFSPTAARALQLIHKPLFDRKPITYDTKWFDDYKPNHTFYLSKTQRKGLHQAGKPKITEMPAGTYAHHLYHRLLIDLSYHSSRLEGNTYSLGETEKLLIEGVASEGKLDAEKIMILNHKEAIRYLVDNANRLSINENTICTLHYLLSDGLVLPKYAGKMRDHAVKISSSSYIPLEGTQQLQRQLISICDVARQIDDPYEQSFFLLVHISFLQAFTDVNKRTARLSANIPLLKNDLYPIAFNRIEKEDYISAILAIYECHEVSALAELYTFSYQYTAHEYEAVSQSIGFNETRVRFRHALRDIIRHIISQEIVGDDARQFISIEAKKQVPSAYQAEFIAIVNQELKEIGPERVLGLGISNQQLKKWLKKSGT